MAGTEFPDWNLPGGSAIIDSVTPPLELNAGVLSIDNATTFTVGVVQINDTYTGTTFHTDATTSFYVGQAINAAISGSYKPVTNVIAFINTNTPLTGVTTVLNSKGATITLANGNNVCLSNQTIPLQNARYVFNAGNLTLTADCLTGSNQQDTVFFETSTGNQYGLTSSTPVIVGTNVLLFTLFADNQMYSADEVTLHLNSSNVFSILNSGVNTVQLANNSVTYAKFQQVAASSLVGNPTGSLANAQGITLTSNLKFTSTTLDTFQPLQTNSSLQFGTLGLGASLVSSSILSLTSTSLGFLPPAMTTSQKNSISSPASGLVVYDLTLLDLQFYNGTSWIGSSLSGVTSVQGTAGQILVNGTGGTPQTGALTLTSPFGTFANVTSAGGTTILTVTSAQKQNLIGSTTQNFQLPDATTLPLGFRFDITNNTNQDICRINNNGGTQIFNLTGGAEAIVTLTSNGTSNGTWDWRFLIPEGVIWNTSILSFNSIDISTFRLSTGTLAGWVMVSDSTGHGTWQSVSATGATTSFTCDTGSATPTTGVITMTGTGSGLTTTGSSSTITLGGTLNVSHGGTGDASFTAYSVICAGTTSTGALQNVSGVGSSTQVLTSNGPSALPSWQSISALGVSSVQGTANQINPTSPTIAAVTLSLSSTIITPGTLAINGMTTGSILFVGASSVVSQDNANFFWDSTNHRLGLAKTNPSFLLDINGSAAITTLFGNSSAQQPNDIIYFGNASQPNFFLDRGGASGGNFVIGFNTIKKSAASSILTIYNNVTDHAALLDIVSAGSSTGVNRVNFPTGNVGINDAAPGSLLSVVGNAQIGFSSGTTSLSNGLAVSGQSSFGTASPVSFIYFTVAPSTSYGYGSFVSGSTKAVGGTNDAVGLFINTVLNSTTSGTANLRSVYISPNYAAGGGSTAAMTGIFIDQGTSTTDPVLGYGLYVTNPLFGATKYSIYTEGQNIFGWGGTNYGASQTASIILGVDGTLAGCIKLWSGTASSPSLIHSTTNNLHLDATAGIYLNWYSGDAVFFGSGTGATRAYIDNNGSGYITKQWAVGSGAASSNDTLLVNFASNINPLGIRLLGAPTSTLSGPSTAGVQIGIFTNAAFSPNVVSSGSLVIDESLQSSISIPAGTQTFGTLVGLSIFNAANQSNASSTSTLSTYYGIVIQSLVPSAVSTSTLAVTTAYGIYINSPYSSATRTSCTTQYSLYIPTPTGATNNYAAAILGGLVLAGVTITTATTLTTSNNIVNVNASAAVTVTLPATVPGSSTAFWVCKIKDISNAATTNNILISGNGHNVDFAASATIATNGGSLEIYADGTQYWIS